MSLRSKVDSSPLEHKGSTQSSFNTEIDNATSCLDSLWLYIRDKLICSCPTVASQAASDLSWLLLTLL